MTFRCFIGIARFFASSLFHRALDFVKFYFTVFLIDEEAVSPRVITSDVTRRSVVKHNLIRIVYLIVSSRIATNIAANSCSHAFTATKSGDYNKQKFNSI